MGLNFIERKLKAGRVGELASVKLGDNLQTLGLKMGRLKTGTCPRVDAKSIDFSVLEIQNGDANPKAFSFRSIKFNLIFYGRTIPWSHAFNLSCKKWGTVKSRVLVML